MASPQAPGKRPGGARSAGAAARALRAAALAAALSVVGGEPALAVDQITAQARDANAEFLAWAPPPPAPAKVCVVDTGVDMTTDVAPNVVARFSVYPGTLDDVGSANGKHGTYVAGVIASQDGDGASVGIWPHAKIVSVRVFREDHGSSVPAFIKAFDTCTANGTKVINLSLSGVSGAPIAHLTELENRINDLRTNEGINVVAAAGNSDAEVAYPAKFASVFAVGASGTSGSFCVFSNRGPELDISTLGCPVELSAAGGTQASGNGTSFSAPLVSGVLAALRAYKPELTVDAAEGLLTQSATTIGNAGPRLNAAAAFRAAGLSRYVDVPGPRQSAPVSETSATLATSVAAPAVALAAPGVQTFQGTTPVTSALSALGVRKPKLRAGSYRRGVLTVLISGVPDFGRAIFAVDQRRYTRASGKLRIRLKHAPKRISVLIDVPQVGRTAPLRVRVKASVRSNMALKRRG